MLDVLARRRGRRIGGTRTKLAKPAAAITATLGPTEIAKKGAEEVAEVARTLSTARCAAGRAATEGEDAPTARTGLASPCAGTTARRLLEPIVVRGALSLILLPVGAELVEARSLVGVAEDLVCLVDVLKLTLRGLIARIDVRVILTGKATVGLFDLVLRRLTLDPEDLIVVLELSRQSTSPLVAGRLGFAPPC